MDILLFLIKLGLMLLKIFVVPFSRIFSLKYGKVCPPLTDPLLLHSAKKLAYMIRTKQVTSEQVIKAYIARVKEVNSVLNAVVQNRFDQAILEAKEVDQFIQTNNYISEQQLERDKPLFGVPFSVKESISLLGMSNAAGVVDPRTIPAAAPADTDADIVRLCKQAGAIPLLVSNTPELCMFWETYNNVTGRTCNPYNTKRTTGGSSGGEAALLGSGASVIGLGSDICGSLRLPAMFTGIHGHKPTPGTVSVEGHVPKSYDDKWTDYFALGPLTRYAEDMPLLLSVIAKPEMKHTLRLNEPVSIKDIKFFYMESESDSFFTNSVNKDIIQGMRTFVSYLENDHGITVQKAILKLMKKSFGISVPVLLNLEKITCLYYNQMTDKFTIWREMLRFLTFRSNITFPVFFFGILKKVSKVLLKNKTKKSQSAADKLKEDIRNLLGDNGVLLYPTFPNLAHYHGEVIHKVTDVSYLAIFNALGLPVTNCPMGYNSNGLPMGIQVVSNPYNDRLTFAVAQEMEKFFGGWKPPSSNLI